MPAATEPPPGVAVHYSQQYRRCGKRDCAVCRPGAPGHGPYWFATWREGGRKRSRYLGRTPPPTAPAGPALADHADPVLAPALPLCVRTLGGFAVWRQGELIALERWRGRRALSLFKLLLGAAGQRLARDAAIEALWPEVEPEAGAHNLRTAVYLLRATIDPPGVAESHVGVSRTSLWLAPGSGGAPAADWLDANAFAAAASAALAGRDATVCRAALARYTGAYLPDDGAAEWAVRRRDALHGQYLAVLQHLAVLSQAAGEHEEAERALRLLLESDPCAEEAARLLMRIQRDGGRPLQAIRTYRRLLRALREDLDLEPDAETQALYMALLAERPDSREARPASDTPPHNLPAALSGFIGRRRELAALRRALAAVEGAGEDDPAGAGASASRLLTLTGPGGCGKTRLALQAADEALEDYPDGAWLVELAALADPGLVTETVGAALGLRQRGGAGRERPLIDQLCDLLRPQRLLLVLDNCEHLIAACARLAETLLRACPHLRILATSREALHVPGETLWPVPPLTLPTGPALPAASQLTQYEAVRLFLERARAQRPGFQAGEENATAIVQICRQLDGLPLAIELAAARVRVLPVEAIAARLDDRFRLLVGGDRTALPRHRTLRAALDWSFDLLGAEEQVLLRRLSVFSGGWTLGAAEAVCGEPELEPEVASRELGREGTTPYSNFQLPTHTVLDLLGELVDKSLVEAQADGSDSLSRYRLLETVRQYAREHLEQTGESAALRDGHLRWYLALAEQAAAGLTGPDQAAWLARLETEADNLRAALQWAGQSGQVHTGLRLAGSLWRFWFTRGYLREGRACLESLLARGDEEAPGPAPERQAVRAKALNGAGALAYYQCDYGAAAAFYAESLALLRALGDTRGVASALNNLGLVRKDEADYDGATQLYLESLALYRSIGDRRGSAMALNNLGIAAGDQGDAARAASYHEESLSLKRLLGDKGGIMTSLNNLGVIAVDQGDYARARVLHEEGLALARELGNKWSEHVALSSLGRLAYAEGAYEQALQRYQESLELCRLLGNDLFSAIILEGIAAVACARGAAAMAARLCAAAEALCEAAGAMLPASDRLAHERTVAATKDLLGAAFEAAWTAGRLLGRDRAFAAALGLTLGHSRPT